MKLLLAPALFLSLSIFAPHALAQTESKVSCTEVDGIVAKCAEIDTQAKACDDAAKAKVKADEDAAKKEQEDCKTKHGITFAMKCGKEIKKVTTLRNTPVALSSSKASKELAKDPNSACAKADTLANETKVCKGGPKVLDAMKRNCIK